MPNAVIVAPEEQKQLPPTKPKKRKVKWPIFIIGILPWTFAIYQCQKTQILNIDTASKGLTAGMNAYEKTKEQSADEVYQSYYDSSYHYAEKKNHVSNQTLITITKVEEINQLEVLEVSQNTVETESSENNASGTFTWLSMTGSAVYVVNLNTAEYVIDQQRSSVIVRIPKPTFEYRPIEEVEELITNTKHHLQNGSIKEGETITQDLIKKGNEEIRSELKANQENLPKAKESAVSLITSLVKQANPEIPNLQVIVEFMD